MKYSQLLKITERIKSYPSISSNEFAWLNLPPRTFYPPPIVYIFLTFLICNVALEMGGYDEQNIDPYY